MSKPIFAVVTGAMAALLSAPLFAADDIQDTPIAVTAIDADEIVVTVRKTEELLSEVPLSVTALSAATLKNSTVQQLSDVSGLTPGLTFLDFNVGALSTPIIRGLAQSNTQGRENNVGVFLDGIYLPSRNNLDLELLDLSRIEVVKGPQGALYGRSTFAGTINYVSADPSDEPELDVTGAYGTDDYAEARLRLSGPIADNVRGSLAASHREFDGTIDNVASNDNLGGYESDSIMGKLAWDFTDNFRGTLMGFFTDKDIDSAGIYNAVNNCGAGNYYCGDLVARDVVDVDPNGKGAEAETTLYSLELVYDFNDNLSLTSLTSKSESDWGAVTDYDANSNGAPYQILDAMMNPAGTQNLNLLFFNDTEDDTFSQELRLNGSTDGFNWLAGVYYTKEEYESTSANTLDARPLNPGDTVSAGFLSFYLNSILTTNVAVPNQLANWDTGETEIWAVFGRGEWDFGENGRLSVEARYSQEDKKVNGILSFGGPGGGTQENDWSYFTPRITYDYDLNENTMLYGSVAMGTKSGGFNANFPASIPSEAFFDEEENTTYEVGAKGTLADGRLQYDLAVFYIDWEDLQVSGSSQDPLFIQAIVRNTGSATSKGLELQMNYALTDSITIGGGYAYADPEYDDGVIDRSLDSVCPNLCSTDVSGKQLGRTVKNQLNLYFDINRQLTQNWDWYAHADYITRGGSPTRSANLQWIEQRNLVNARLGITNDNWDIAVWAKNLFDENYVTSQIRQPTLNDFSRPTTVIMGTGQQLALSVTYKMGR